MAATSQYLCYDETEETWYPVTLAELAAINNPELLVCPINADGSFGSITTYAAIRKRGTHPILSILFYVFLGFAIVFIIRLLTKPSAEK